MTIYKTTALCCLAERSTKKALNEITEHVYYISSNYEYDSRIHNPNFEYVIKNVYIQKTINEQYKQEYYVDCMILSVEAISSELLFTFYSEHPHESIYSVI